MIFTVLGFIFEPDLQLSPAAAAAVEVCVYAATAASAAAAAAWKPGSKFSGVTPSFDKKMG